MAAELPLDSGRTESAPRDRFGRGKFDVILVVVFLLMATSSSFRYFSYLGLSASESVSLTHRMEPVLADAGAPPKAGGTAAPPPGTAAPAGGGAGGGAGGPPAPARPGGGGAAGGAGVDGGNRSAQGPASPELPAETARPTPAPTAPPPGAPDGREATDIGVHTNVAIFVFNKRDNAAQRKAVRETWAKGLRNVYFVVGKYGCGIPPQYRSEHSCEAQEGVAVPEEEQAAFALKQEKLDAALLEEARFHSDMIFTPHLEEYRRLPRKLKEAYRWGLAHTNANWFVKVDDDAAVRVRDLDAELRTRKASRKVLGCVHKRAEVRKSGKWAEHNYPKAFYPPLPLGSCGHAVSRDVAEYVVRLDGFEYQGEDTSLAIWVSEWKGGNVEVIKAPSFNGNTDCQDESHLTAGGRGFSEGDLRGCFPGGAPCPKSAVIVPQQLRRRR